MVNQEVLGSSQVTCFSLRNLLRIRLGSAVHVIRCQRRGKVGVQRKQLLFIFQVQELIAWCKKHSITSGGVGSDTGPGCGIHVFTVVFIGVQKREKGVSHKKLS